MYSNLTLYICGVKILKTLIKEKITPPGGFEPPTFRLTAERASRLRHGGIFLNNLENLYLY